MDMKPSAIADAARAAGNPYRLSRALGVSHVAVRKWLQSGKPPAERCLRIEAITGISRYRLRPDVYGPEPGERAA